VVSAMLLAGLAWMTGPQATPAATLVPTCSLVAPNGDAIGFKVLRWEPSGSSVGLITTEGSVWPLRTLVGEWIGSGGNAFAFGGDDGLIVQLGEGSEEAQPIAIHRRDGAGAGLPLAYGFCRPGPAPTVFGVAADPQAIGGDIAAFDPQSWPDGCALLLTDGRRLRLSYRLNRDRAEFANAELWPNGPIHADLQRRRPERGVGIARFSRREGVRGTEFFFVQRNPARAVKLLQFDAIGGGAEPDQRGFAICGYASITRRPAA